MHHKAICRQVHELNDTDMPVNHKLTTHPLCRIAREQALAGGSSTHQEEVEAVCDML